MSACSPSDYKKLVGNVVVYNHYERKILKNSYLILVEDMIQGGKNQMYEYKMRILHSNMLLDEKAIWKNIDEYPFKFNFSNPQAKSIYDSFNVYCRDVYSVVNWSKESHYDAACKEYNRRDNWISFDCWLRGMSGKVSEMQNLIQPIVQYANVQLPS